MEGGQGIWTKWIYGYRVQIIGLEVIEWVGKW